MKDYPEEFSEEEIKQMWNDFGKEINRCFKELSKINEELRSRISFTNAENNKLLSEMTVLKDKVKNAFSEINQILDKTKETFNENKLKHIAVNFIRKALEIQIKQFSEKHFERIMKGLSPELESLGKQIKYVKKWLRESIKKETWEITKLKKEKIRKQNPNMNQKAESEESSKSVTKSVTKEPNSI